MNTPHPTYPRLQASPGAALPGLQLPTTPAEALEDALAEANEQAPPSAFFARLRGIAHSHAADGQAWRERQLSEARGRDQGEAYRERWDREGHPDHPGHQGHRHHPDLRGHPDHQDLLANQVFPNHPGLRVHRVHRCRACTR